jgi:hypothetical protein
MAYGRNIDDLIFVDTCRPVGELDIGGLTVEIWWKYSGNLPDGSQVWPMAEILLIWIFVDTCRPVGGLDIGGY